MDETTPEKPSTSRAAQGFLSASYLSDRLEEAELLLGYAAGAGIEVDDEIRDGIIGARIATDGNSVTKQTADDLLTALTALSVIVRPVTVKSLRDSADPKAPLAAIRSYGTAAIVIGLIILISSILAFASSSISEKIKADVETANALAAKLRSELGPWPEEDQPTSAATAEAGKGANLSQDQVWYGTDKTPPGLSDKDVISDLSLFAATVREIDGYSRQLKYWSLDFEDPPYVKALKNSAGADEKNERHRPLFELKPGLDIRLAEELTDRVKEYQRVRNFGNLTQEKVMLFWGAFATFILPVLYALLGADAYLLRMFDDQIKNRTWVDGGRHIARFLIAAIGGLVVGLFNNVTQGITISPFAVAFLVGYAVDVFFAFLEGMLQIFKRGAGTTGAQGTSSGPPN